VEQINTIRGTGGPAGYYGAAGVNVFEATSNPWCRSQLYDVTHKQYSLFWDAKSNSSQGFAYALGLVGQNDTWGTNSTALTKGLIFGQEQGYVVAKAVLLAEDLPLSSFGVNLPESQATELYQDFISLAVEGLFARSRPHLGAILAHSARRRTDRFPSMLVDAYAKPIAGSCGTDAEFTATMIERQEKSYRRTVYNYGRFVHAGGRAGFKLVVAHWADLTSATWANQGLHSVSAGKLRRISRFYLRAAERLVRSDYLDELRATADFVQDEIIRQLFSGGGGSPDGGTTDGSVATDGSNTE
jgi:hypothetical protein